MAFCSFVALASCRLYRCRPGGIPGECRQDAGGTAGGTPALQKSGKVPEETLALLRLCLLGPASGMWGRPGEDTLKRELHTKRRRKTHKSDAGPRLRGSIPPSFPLCYTLTTACGGRLGKGRYMPFQEQFWSRFLVTEMDPLLIVSIILIAGFLGGWVAARLHVPRITGNMLAGLLVGPACLDLFPEMNVAATLQPLTNFAMGLITVSIGSTLSYRRIHNALRRIIAISVAEVFAAAILVTVAFLLLGMDWQVAFAIGCIAASTAPATILALVREVRAKGTFVKTLLSVVALDNLLCIMLFAFSSTLLADFYENSGQSVGVGYAAAHAIWQFAGSVLLALVLGKVTERLVHHVHTHDFSVVFVAVLLSVGLSESFDLSPLLTSLFFGIYLGNASEETARQTQALEPIELLLFSCFFTVAGASLHLDTVAEAGVLCVAFIVARGAGKAVGAWLGGLLARTSKRIRTSMSLGLMPEAGVAIGLVLLLGDDPRIPSHTWELINTLVLGAVTVNEILGPFFTRQALKMAKETDKDRRRIIEFLQEEYITVGLTAKDKFEALRKLTDFYARTHHVPPGHQSELLASIEEREKEFTTAIGLGAAIPHGRIEEGSGVRGVLAIAREGIDFHAPDGEPVRLMMLVVTPKGYEKEHLEVMASLAQMISDNAIRTRLLAAIDANDAWEIIESEDTRNYNYFLDQEGLDEEVQEDSRTQ